MTFTEAFTATDGTVYTPDQVYVMTAEELTALYTAPVSEEEAAATPAPAAGFSCMPAASTTATVSVPCKYEPNYEPTEYGKKIPGENGLAKWKFIRTLSVVFFGISLADIVFLLIFTNKMTDKAKKAKAQAAAAGHRVSGMPTGAFSFDEDEPLAPDDPKVTDTEAK